ncbi:hypothetical protein [Hyalangium gracile]|uniref:hypothetical protein n=1 Tax=Hyalangium gracile TaxID=394092 RepID=UPI001CC97D33|nr:hypothetical protein [Hyalangium gracile]
MIPDRTEKLEIEPRQSTPMAREELVAWMQHAVLEIHPVLSLEQVLEESSLVHDLGFDSLSLESLMAMVKSRVPGVDLTPWYVRAAQHGQDTIASLVDFLLEARPPPTEGDEP